MKVPVALAEAEVAEAVSAEAVVILVWMQAGVEPAAAVQVEGEESRQGVDRPTLGVDGGLATLPGDTERHCLPLRLRWLLPVSCSS